MPTEKYDLNTIDYSVQGWDSVLATDMEKLDDVIPSREIVLLGETVTAYQALCFNAVDSKWYKAQANGTLQPAHGLALEGGDDDDEVRIHRMGKITNAGWDWASLGDPVYLDPDTAGELTQTPPESNKQFIGYALSAQSMLVVVLPEIAAAAGIEAIVEDTAPQLGGDLDLNAKSIDIAAAPSADTWEGIVVTATAHENVVLGSLCFVNPSGEMALSDADDAATMPGLYMATAAIDADDPGVFLRSGIIHLHTLAPAWTVGALIYAGSSGAAHTPGAIHDEAPSGSGDQVQVIGVALAADILDFRPSHDFGELA
jgi:hypothetical protein